MARSPKSQWDFGDLFTSAPARSVLSVTDLTLQIKRSLEKGFGSVWVTGEISNYRLQSSGHAYFVLKDANAQLQSVLFRSQPGLDRSILRDGARVILGGELTVYEPRGQYQLRVTHAEAQGIGALQAAFERLKAKLQSEGLFDPSRKRPLPRFPKRLGLVTSPTGAAIRDVLHVIQRRYAGLEIVLAPSKVQGEGSATDIVSALSRLNQWSASQPPHQRLDVLLLTRGGGSLEDLWTFNEESVARAIAASEIPVISAIGHEIDFTISDFVADFRAATPSAAAEILTQDYVASRDFAASASERLQFLARQRLTRTLEQTDALQRRLGRLHPRRQLEQRGQHLDELQTSLLRLAQRSLKDRTQRLDHLRHRFAQVRPANVLARHRESVEDLKRRLPAAAVHGHKTLQSRLATLSGRLSLLSPQNVLNRGYSITLDAATGAVIRSDTQVSPGQHLRTRLSSGELQSIATAPTHSAPDSPQAPAQPASES